MLPLSSLRLTQSSLAVVLVWVSLIASFTHSAPVDQSLKDTLKSEEDMLLLLVPSVPIQKGEAPIAPEKVEYDLIAIPGEVLRREIRNTGHKYGPLGQKLRPVHAQQSADVTNSLDTEQVLQFVQEQVKYQELLKKKQLSDRENNRKSNNQNDRTDGDLHSLSHSGALQENTHDKRSFFGSSGGNNNDNGLNNKIRQATDTIRTVGGVVQGVGSVVSTFKQLGGGAGAATGGLGGLGGAVSTLSTIGSIKKKIANKLIGGLGGGGTSTSVLPNILDKFSGQGGDENILSGLASLTAHTSGSTRTGGSGGSGGGLGDIFGTIQGIKGLGSGVQGTVSSIKDSFSGVTSGLQYVGRLSTSILKILLQIPGIKARVITEIVQASTPLKSTISDVISENADDMRGLMEASTEIISDAFDILIRLVSDVLALKGRMIASFSANGLDSGASVFDGGLRVGGALVQTAGDIGTAIGKGVGDVVEVVSDANVPPLPQLPSLPQIPNLGSLLGIFNLGGSGAVHSTDDDLDSYEIGKRKRR